MVIHMKLIKIIGLFCLFCVSFFYTEKVINVTLNQDEIMIKIKEYNDTYNNNPTNAIIKDDTIIPGNVGKYIDEESSYKAMKKIGYFEPTLINYKNIYPEISIYNNYNKYIINGNTKNKYISLIYIINNNNTLNNILDIISKDNINITFFIDSSYLNNNINLLSKLNNKEVYNYGNTGVYTKDNLIITNNIINNKTNNKSIYCLFLNKDDNSLNNCANSKMLSILVNKDDNYYTIKDNLSNGKIYVINNTKELSNINKYIISKGYTIVPLSNIINEE